MTAIAARVARAGLAVGILAWVALAQLSVVVFGYQMVRVAVPTLPPFSPSSLAAVATDPIAIGGFGVAFATSAIVGRRRYGTLAGVAVAATKRADSVLGASLFDDPLLEGRVRHDGVAWRLRYWEDDRIEVLRRECPFCGLELAEAVLPSRVVYAENTAVDPGDAVRETAAEAWEDVYGSEKADERAEELALACPQCNFSIPGSKDVLAGADGARATFRRHVDHMRAGNPGADPFESYADAARDGTGGDPSPEAVWDAYVGARDDEDVLRVGLDPATGVDAPDPDSIGGPTDDASGATGGAPPSSAADGRSDADGTTPEPAAETSGGDD